VPHGARITVFQKQVDVVNAIMMIQRIMVVEQVFFPVKEISLLY
jgi:hypothetical protein